MRVCKAIIDEFTRECLAIRVGRRLRSTDVIDVLSDLFILRGVPSFIRSGNGPEFISKALRDWLWAVGAKTATIEPGSPWENGFCESFNAFLRDELLNDEIFYSLRGAQIIIEAGGFTTTDRTWPSATSRRLPRSRYGRLSNQDPLRRLHQPSPRD